METVGDAALGLPGEDRDQARIDTSRNIGTDRHVAAQVHPDRIVEQLAKTPFEISRAVIAVYFVTDIPVSPDAELVVLDRERMTRQ